MNRRLVITLVLLIVLISVATSFIIRPTKPIIDIKGEVLVTVYDTGNAFTRVIITNTLLTSWLVTACLVAFAFWANRRLQPLPTTRLQNLLEAIVEGIRDFVYNVAGEHHGRRFFPVVATIFIMVAITNWFALLPFFNAIGKVEPLGAESKEFHSRNVVFDQAGVSLIMPGSAVIEPKVDEGPCNPLSGVEKDHCLEQQRERAIEAAMEKKDVGEGKTVGILAPYFRSVNTDLNSPLSLAIISAFFVETWGITSLGFRTYVSRFVNTRKLRQGQLMTGAIDVFVGVLEFIAEVARLISFTFRLFGNMLAGEILLLVMTFLLPFVFIVVDIFYGLELFVGVIQAFIFAALTLVFGVIAVSAHEEHEAGEEAAESH